MQRALSESFWTAQKNRTAGFSPGRSRAAVIPRGSPNQVFAFFAFFFFFAMVLSFPLDQKSGC
jgi:hypothetical protein